jgi:transposase
MTTAATPKPSTTVLELVLCVAFELGVSEWKMAFSTGLGQQPRHRVVPARDLAAVRVEVDRAKARFGLPATAAVASCYEAGRDGFWIHRALVEMGIENIIVDSASIEVNRRSRRAKTDRLDAGKLVGMLLRYRAGERTVWSVVRVPSVEEEDRRHLHRELKTAKRDRTRITNRVKSLLFSQGVRLVQMKELPQLLGSMRLWNGKPLPKHLRARIEREWKQVVLLTEKIKELTAERRKLLRKAKDPGTECARKLLRLGGIGDNAAWLFALEFFSWRQFRNRREVGALAGLTPTPYQSGDDSREQGICKAGNRWIRALAIEIAWGWLRFQPDSELSRWYHRRFGHGSSRLRKIGIVALARKLLVELWKYVETGTPPAGAVLKPVPVRANR